MGRGSVYLNLSGLWRRCREGKTRKDYEKVGCVNIVLQLIKQIFNNHSSECMKSGENIFRLKSYQLMELWLWQRLVYLSNINWSLETLIFIFMGTWGYKKNTRENRWPTHGVASTEEHGVFLGKFLKLENDRNLFIEISNRYEAVGAFVFPFKVASLRETKGVLYRLNLSREILGRLKRD